MRRSVRALVPAAAALLAACASTPFIKAPPDVLPGPVLHVVHVSVDGLRPDAVTTLGPAGAPTFHRLRREGAFTDNARTDPDIAATLPNHVAQLTGRPVFGHEGHGFLANSDPGPPTTVHLVATEYVMSVLDVVHDSGFSTAFYASKDKFALLERSWDEWGAADITGEDDGTDKIDDARIEGDAAVLMDAFLAALARDRPTYAFLHLRQPDSAGHSDGWDLALGSGYMTAVAEVDRELGRLLALLESDPELRGTTALIVTADHGGDLGTENHVLLPEVGLYESGIVPFLVWGPGVAPGADLYALNDGVRADPGRSIPDVRPDPQPIRNGEAGNLALQLLGLPPIPGSTFGAEQDLRLR